MHSALSESVRKQLESANCKRKRPNQIQKSLADLLASDFTQFRSVLSKSGLIRVLKNLDGQISSQLDNFQREMETNSFIIENYHLDRLFEDSLFNAEREDEFNITWYSGQNTLLSVVWVGHTVSVAGHKDTMMES
jgi:hypothetical protein